MMPGIGAVKKTRGRERAMASKGVKRGTEKGVADKLARCAFIHQNAEEV